MKKIILTIATIAITTISAQAQLVRIYKGESLVATYTQSQVDRVVFSEEIIGEPNGHEYVDLGLPSGLKWATCNVGATSPEDYGDYFAWGETEPYYTEGHAQDNPCSDWKTGKTGYDWASYKWCNGTYNSLTKYNTNSDLGTVDNKTELEPADDAARQNWGGSWRMPTQSEFYELYEYCTWTWTTQNSVYGYKVTGSNGNWIFLPAAGYRGGTNLKYDGSYGYFWSSTPSPYDPSYASYLYLCSSGFSPSNYNDRCYGQSVRPVTE